MNNKTFVFLLLCVTGLLSIRLRQNEMLANATDDTSMNWDENLANATDDTSMNWDENLANAPDDTSMNWDENLANATDDTSMNRDRDWDRDSDRDEDYDDWDNYDEDYDRDMSNYMRVMDSRNWNETNYDWNEINLNMTGFSLSLNYNNRLGNHLIGRNGMSLYYFSSDHMGTNFTEQDFNITCYDECARNWPPVLVTNENIEITYGSGLNPNFISSRLRNDGLTQLTYNNIPLYYYWLDTMPGDIKGHGLFGNGGYWYLINAEGHPIKS